MPRIKLAEKSSYRFSTTCPVRADDINYGGHMDNARFVSFLHEAELLIRCDIDEIEARGFRMFYRMENGGAVAALAETGIIAFDYGKRTFARVPQTFVDRVKAYKQ